MGKRKIYQPPSLAAIGAVVNKACDQLSEQDQYYARPEVRQGFIRFLWHASIVLAKHLSEADGQDTTIDNAEK